ncbi:hypothetical protein F2Q70_00015799 [Brassica cretica]|uniref:Uncharacterized protein n=1 Tax=Brassica cretica TaxID=69181 RepID=A0A8S9HQQ8_BRACR|nr:hypothetical protein F2Q70_00015799 [Brassica cretica]
MSGNTKEKNAVRNNAGKKTPAATAPMANATVLEKIENLAATFHHRKCNEMSSRFPFFNIKGNNKSYQTPPQKSPPLRSLLNPHRNAFRFVSIGVSVEILRRKQLGLFLAYFYSLHSDLSDFQPATQRPVRPQKAPPLCSHLNPDRNAFRFVSIRVSVEILRRKQVRLV